MTKGNGLKVIFLYSIQISSVSNNAKYLNQSELNKLYNDVSDNLFYYRL